jgi:hypothetical protein
MSFMDSTLRPMSTSQVLDRTFHLYRNHFVLFAGISALPPAVILLWQTSFALLAFIPVAGRNPALSGIAFVAGLVAMIVGYLAALSLATGATVYAVSRVHLGHAVRIGESYKVIRPLLWRIVRIVISVAVRFTGAICIAVFVGVTPMALLRVISPSLNPGSSILVTWVGGTLVVVAVIVCAIWALRLYCSYQLAVPVCVLERLGAAACLKRSRFLSKGKGVQRILLILFLCAILTYVLVIVLSVPIFIFAALGVAGKTPQLAVPMVIWQYLASFLAGAIAGPIVTIAFALLYYDERVRKEAFDLQLLMEAMGEASSASPATAAASGAIG